MNNRSAILLNWKLSDLSGWGIAGLEIFSYMALRGKFQPAMTYGIDDFDIRSFDSFRKNLLMPSFQASNQFSSKIISNSGSFENQEFTVNIPVVHALGNQFASSDIKISGSKNIARIVFEFDNFVNFWEYEKKFDAFIVASKWNYDILSKYTSLPIYLNHEGVDVSRFYPAPKSGLFNDNDFLVFSGGKIEYRKGQDLVLEVFKRFSHNKRNVKLVTAWQSIYASSISHGFRGILDSELEVNSESTANILKWAVDNGISASKIIDLGQTPHFMMPYVLKEMDCAIQLSRAEGGTNFVAMECMASGIPTLITKCTGHFDILDYQNAIPINVVNRAISTSLAGAEDWREADIDDAVNNLEKIYYEKMNSRINKSSQCFPRTWIQHSVDFEEILTAYV